jgi:hypothetical protein
MASTLDLWRFFPDRIEPDDFGRNRNAISSKVLNPPLIKVVEHDVVRKPVSTFRHHALGNHAIGMGSDGSPALFFITVP